MNIDNTSNLEIIIPVKDRYEIRQCVQSLNSTEITKVIVCDGGSTDVECLESLPAIEQDIVVINIPMSGFNKSRLINKGIEQAKREFILISDADIIWNQAAIDALLNKVKSDDNIICCIQDVEESNPASVALKRDRYTYNITQPNLRVDILPDLDLASDRRPGCGIICARRTTLISLGGYKEFFQGWGWEDQDLLIRAKLCGINICASGKIIHISHDDTTRNRYYNNIAPHLTRNKNIILSMNSLAQGILWGDLQMENFVKPTCKKIQVHLPDSLVECSTYLNPYQLEANETKFNYYIS